MSLQIGNKVGIGHSKGAPFNWRSWWMTTEKSLYVKEGTRNGLSLPDTIAPGTGDPKIIPACIKTTFLSSGSYIDTGIAPAANTIWVWQGAMWEFQHGYFMGALDSFKMCSSSSGGGKWYLKWGNTAALSSSACDNNWHTFLIYNKKMWVLPFETALTDANLLSIIAGTTATINVGAPATWIDAANNITYGKVGPSNSYATIPWYLSVSYIGTITDNVITWQRKHIFNNTHACYDLLNSANHGLWVVPEVSGSIKLAHYNYNHLNASQHCLDNGYSLYRCESLPDIHVPYLLTGVPQTTPSVPTGYVWIKDVTGNSQNHNLARSKIRFALGSIWDRSVTAVWSDACRSASDYDASNPTDFDIVNLNALQLFTWLNTGYKYRLGVHFETNSVDEDDRAEMIELFSFPEQISASRFNGLLKYTNDYDLVIL